jgi:site-specific recombinase XerD
MTGEQIFEEWLAMRSLADARDRLDRNNAEPYRWIWSSWLRWLAAADPAAPLRPRAADWTKASTAQVLQFLERGVQPRQRNKPAAKRKGGGLAGSSRKSDRNSQVSEVTKRRYWRLLQRVYEFAKGKQLLHVNPADTDPGKAPAPEKTQGAIMHPRAWSALKALVAAPTDKEAWLDARDRAIMMLFMELGLTPAELSTLQISEAQPGPKAKAFIVHIKGKRKHQQRDLVASNVLTKALQAWRVHRGEFLERKRETAGKHVQPEAQDLFFLSLRLGALSWRSIYHLVEPLMQSAAKEAGIGRLPHLGPVLLRNTRIVMWHQDNVPMVTLLKNAGLQNEESLRGLASYITIRKRAPRKDRKIVE